MWLGCRRAGEVHGGDKGDVRWLNGLQRWRERTRQKWSSRERACRPRREIELVAEVDGDNGVIFMFV